MVYVLFYFKLCCMYDVNFVCIINDIKFVIRKMVVYVYLCFVLRWVFVGLWECSWFVLWWFRVGWFVVKFGMVKCEYVGVWVEDVEVSGRGFLWWFFFWSVLWFCFLLLELWYEESRGCLLGWGVLVLCMVRSCGG